MPGTHRIALLFGGRSGEHEVSVRSAASVSQALRQRHELTLVRVSPEGAWTLVPDVEAHIGEEVFLAPTPTDGGRLRRLRDGTLLAEPEVYFPLIHGTFGEDGTLQGLLELASVPYVGSGVLASATGMDKAVMKALFAEAGLPQGRFEVVTTETPTAEIAGVVERLGWPVFVKPANMGSSVGVTRVARWEMLPQALEDAFEYDTKVVIEAAVNAREIEVSVLGNASPESSVPGEILADREFYDFDSKYSAESRTRLLIPAPLSPDTAREVRSLALRAFRAIDASGYARVDFFLDRDSERWLVNEINTIPGFTSISMFAKLWEATNLPFDDLVDRLVALAIERHAQRLRLRTTRDE